MTTWIKDAIERVFFTFVEAFLAVVIVAGTNWFDLSTIRAAGVAGLAAVAATVKALIAAKFTNTISPASMATAA